MVQRKKYVLGDFTQYSLGDLADSFAAIADTNLYEFAEKLYLDDKNKAHQCHMLLVGHYSRKSGGPPVCARATGQRICYYSGARTQVTPLNRDIHSSKVYYDPPFSWIGGSLNYSDVRRGMNSERRLERAVVETAINFIFLASGRLQKVLDLLNPDMLSNFRLACRNFSLQRKTCRTIGYARSGQRQGMETARAAVSEDTQLHKPTADDSQLVHLRKEAGSVIMANCDFVDLTDESCDVRDHKSNKRARLLEHIDSYEAEIHAKLKHEIYALRAQLDEQREKTRAKKERLIREKSKRRQAQAELQRCNEEYATQRVQSEQVRVAVKPEPEGEGQDWKSMLFEQERQTEHYKLEYMALKKQKAELIAHNQELESRIYTLERKVTGQKAHLGPLNARHVKARKIAREREEALVRQSQELAKEKEACIFWQRKHSTLLTKSRDRPLRPSTPTGRHHRASDMQGVRPPLDNERTTVTSMGRRY